jgi:hypothetical protein
MRRTKKHKSQIPALIHKTLTQQNPNTTKPLHFQNYNLQFETYSLAVHNT